MDVAPGTDLRGLRLVECDLRGARLVGCEVDDVRIDAFAGDLGSLVVEGVEVSGFVHAELDRRFPERVAVREARTAADLRAAWDVVDGLWRGTVAQAPADLVDRRVDGEWSLAETLRHLVFAADVWAGRVLGAGDEPFCPLGLPTTDTGPGTYRELGLDTAARPGWAEVVELFSTSLDRVGAVFAAARDEELDRPRVLVPYAERGELRTTVRRAHEVLLREHVDHRRYALRDPAVATDR
ncbi:DinB family protein [Klenkia brasiliensis]|uniref:DinB superfamily protein n=1 Tax=Klenkia brasiliensis TaxID=333142 RepID=A0A1G7SWR6_9ACTN|nr:DinB family protein [Klenkia brasiliensis]SDG27526.1 DinB superfamily protein [Klenkia brasiliensis]